jgi:phenylpyruvate tautomerase PptA (4-oxalocrotonate tautomerase family)
MPVIKLTLIQGYDDTTRQRLATRLTDAVLSVIAAPIDGITVAIEEVQAASYMRGRQSRKPGKPLPGAGEIVRSFLTAMERRDLDKARTYLAPGFTMIFPGNQQFTALEELVEWSQPRYQSVSKTFETVDEAFGPDGMVVVCQGTLSGRWPDGTAFSGIRFVDRFELSEGKIVRQQVWNDIAEQRAGGD